MRYDTRPPDALIEMYISSCSREIWPDDPAPRGSFNTTQYWVVIKRHWCITPESWIDKHTMVYQIWPDDPALPQGATSDAVRHDTLELYRVALRHGIGGTDLLQEVPGQLEVLHAESKEASSDHQNRRGCHGENDGWKDLRAAE